MKTLITDNYGSFVYNLVQYVGELGGGPVVHRNDQISVDQARKMQPDRIIISPGPGTPEDPRYFGTCSAILREMRPKTPTQGVCRGCQGIVHVFGGRIARARRLMHGNTSMIQHDGKGVFKNVRKPLRATRYHSLVAQKASIPSCLEITAEALDYGEIMAVRHREEPMEGMQFNPESILTEDGMEIIQNFLKGA